MNGREFRKSIPTFEEVRGYISRRYCEDDKGRRHRLPTLTREGYEETRRLLVALSRVKILFRTMVIKDLDAFVDYLRMLNEICASEDKEKRENTRGVGVHWTMSAYFATKFNRGVRGEAILEARLEDFDIDAMLVFHRNHLPLMESEYEIQLEENTEITLLNIRTRRGLDSWDERSIGLRVFT